MKSPNTSPNTYATLFGIACTNGYKRGLTLWMDVDE